MRPRPSSTIRPYGRDWNSDRSAPDYDPQRDPWNPGSPVFGQWPRRTWIREAVKNPIWWALTAWFVVTFSLVLLHFVGVISDNTLLVGWVAKYSLLFAAFAIAGIWSLVVWIRNTPAADRGPAFRQWLKRLPGFLALFIGGMVVCIRYRPARKTAWRAVFR